MLHVLSQAAPEGAAFFDMLGQMEGEERYGLIREILVPEAGNMFVTPKEVDAVIARLAHIIAGALNVALHPGITADDVNRYLT
jgi:spore protease